MAELTAERIARELARFGVLGDYDGFNLDASDTSGAGEGRILVEGINEEDDTYVTFVLTVSDVEDN